MTLPVLFDLGGMEKSDQKIDETLAAPIVALYISMCWLVDVIAGITWNGHIKELIETRVLTMFMSSGSEVQFLGKTVGNIGALWFLAALFAPGFFWMQYIWWQIGCGGLLRLFLLE